MCRLAHDCVIVRTPHNLIGDCAHTNGFSVFTEGLNVIKRTCATNDNMFILVGGDGFLFYGCRVLSPERLGSVGCRPLRRGGGPSLHYTLAFAIWLRKIVEKLDQNRRKMLTTFRFTVIGPSFYGQAGIACCFRLRPQATFFSLRCTQVPSQLLN